MFELVRWGARFLQFSEPGDHFEPSWLRLGFTAFARKTATPERSFAIRIDDSEGADFHVMGGHHGTEVKAGLAPADVTLWVSSPPALFALASRQLSPAQALSSGAIRLDSDASLLDDFPVLFDMASDSPGPQSTGV